MIHVADDGCVGAGASTCPPSGTRRGPYGRAFVSRLVPEGVTEDTPEATTAARGREDDWECLEGRRTWYTLGAAQYAGSQ